MRALVSVLLFTFSLQAQSVRLVRIATGLPNPTEIAAMPGDSSRLFVVEQRGRVRVLKNGALLETPMLDLTGRVSCCGERGLLGLAFPSKERFYVYYTDPSGNIVISRFQISAADPDRADSSSETVLARISHPDFQNHNGGHLAFDHEGYLYAGTGDGGSAGDPRGNAQNRSSFLGKLLRFSVERDNSAIPEIWAYGLRNPWKY
jgi:glucose/arabinose dehydrogenase